jgi:hypothetical protein
MTGKELLEWLQVIPNLEDYEVYLNGQEILPCVTAKVYDYERRIYLVYK